jgi:putative ABC transport system permease protein
MALSHGMSIGRDLRFALRTLWSAPLVSILAVACIGLGIGAVTTVYSTASAFTFRPLPQLRDAGRLVLISETRQPDLSGVTVTPATFGDLQALRELTAVAALANWTANVAGLDIPERVGAARVSSDFFRMTGRTAALGRTITRSDILEDQPVVVLSYGLWQRRFGSDSTLLGRTIRIDGEGHQVIGVMPADFVFPAGTQLWTPLTLSPSAAADRATRSLFVMARLGAGRERAALAVTLLGERIAAGHPDTHKGWLLRLQDAEAFFGQGPRPYMVVMLAAVGFLLLISWR